MTWLSLGNGSRRGTGVAEQNRNACSDLSNRRYQATIKLLATDWNFQLARQLFLRAVA